jgi:hypothetical protein
VRITIAVAVTSFDGRRRIALPCLAASQKPAVLSVTAAARCRVLRWAP